MADFTTGVIDLSVENVFDNVDMGATDTMTFSNSGTGGDGDIPIVVLGDFTVASGAVITLRNGVNLTPGTIDVGGNVVSLNAGSAVSGIAGTGGAGAFYYSAVRGGAGGAGGANGNNGVLGANGWDTETGNFPLGGAGGIYPSGNGSNAPIGVGYTTGGGGGGACGTQGASTENVSFLVFGNVNIAGTVTGVGGNGGNGGAGGNGYEASVPGGGGGGGAGGGGGYGGSLYIFHAGTQTTAGITKTLTGGTAGSGGAKGLKGTALWLYSASDGTAGTAGTAGDAGDVVLTEVDVASFVLTNTVSNIYSTQVNIGGNVVSDGGSAITERGFCWDTSIDPTTADDSITANGTTGSYSSLITGLSPDTVYYIRAYAINGIGTSYGNNIQFKTAKTFISRPFMAN